MNDLFMSFTRVKIQKESIGVDIMSKRDHSYFIFKSENDLRQNADHSHFIFKSEILPIQSVFNHRPKTYHYEILIRISGNKYHAKKKSRHGE